MSVNIPFNLYKIYQTGVEPKESNSEIRKDTSILCFLTEQQNAYHDFLMKVLAAARIEEDTVQIISLADGEMISLAEKGWLDQLNYLFCFGLPLSDLHIQIQSHNYHPLRILNTTILPFPDLSVIEPSREEKQKLWDLLKKIFIDA